MKLIRLVIILFLFNISIVFSNDEINFSKWKDNFRKVALSENISENTFDLVMSDVKFLPKVIEYDRFQPEFYEDTKTYISKRTSVNKVKKGINFYNKSNILINTEFGERESGEESILMRPYEKYKDYLADSYPSGKISKVNFFSTNLKWWVKPYLSIILNSKIEKYNNNLDQINSAGINLYYPIYLKI